MNFPKVIPVFPLSNFIMFPNTSVPLNIFEPRYIEMINDSMRSEKLIGMIQPKKTADKKVIPELYKVGCLGKIRSFQETESGTFLIELKGIIRFSILNEIQSDKKYRLCEVDYSDFNKDLEDKQENVKFSDLELIFKNLKSLFEKKGFIINWKALEKQSLDEIINALAMASPFSLEEKQILLESIDVNTRKEKMELILNNYVKDEYENTTVQ